DHRQLRSTGGRRPGVKNNQPIGTCAGGWDVLRAHIGSNRLKRPRPSSNAGGRLTTTTAAALAASSVFEEFAFSVAFVVALPVVIPVVFSGRWPATAEALVGVMVAVPGAAAAPNAGLILIDPAFALGITWVALRVNFGRQADEEQGQKDKISR